MTTTLEVSAEAPPAASLANAHIVLGFAGVALALLLWATLRARFLTRSEQYGRSVAIITAAAATAASAGALLILLAHGKAGLPALHPLMIAAPTGLSLYAITTLSIDAFAAARIGRRRRQIATFAIFAMVALPLVMGFSALSLGAKVIVAIIVLGALLAL